MSSSLVSPSRVSHCIWISSAEAMNKSFMRSGAKPSKTKLRGAKKYYHVLPVSPLRSLVVSSSFSPHVHRVISPLFHIKTMQSQNLPHPNNPSIDQLNRDQAITCEFFWSRKLVEGERATHQSFTLQSRLEIKELLANAKFVGLSPHSLFPP